MAPRRFDKVLNFLFRRILSLNKSEFTSLPFTVLLLIVKCLLGTFMIMSIFFSDSTSITIGLTIQKLLFLQDSQEKTNNIATCTAFSGLNILIGVLFFNCFRKKSSEIIDKILLILLLTVQTFKYVLIVMICGIIEIQVSNGEVIYAIINSLNCIVILFWNYIFENFYFTLNYSTKNLIARFNFQIHVFTQFVLMGLTIIMTLIGAENLNNGLQIVFNLAFFITKGIFIYKSLLKWLYVNRNVQELYSLLVMVELVTLLANMIIQITNQHLLKSNFFVCILITASFCFFGWRSYFYWNREDVYFIKGKDIKDTSKAIIYLKAMHDIMSKNQHNDQNNSLIMASIKKQHEIQCKNSSCYCHTQNEPQFIRQYLMQQLQALRHTFKNSPKILIQQLNLRFYMFHAYPDILNRLQLIKSHFSLSLTQDFSLLTLKTQVIKLIDEKNLALHTIDVQSPLRLQEVSNKLEGLIKKQIEKKTKKWKYLSRGLCRIQELEQDTNLQISYLKDISKIHTQEMYNFKRSILFNLLIMFYYKKVSFLNVKTEEIQKNLKDQLSKIKEEELFSKKEFSKWIFHKRSCVIESLIDDQNFGLVTRSSKNIYEMFGYHQNKVIGMNLNKLMPNFMRGEHDNIIKDWIKTGTWRTVGKLKQIFCIHKDQLCFTALIYLKVIANQKGLFFIAVIFKKNESDYLVLNQKQELQGVGRKFLYLIGQNCKKMPIQIFCNDFPALDMAKQQDYKYFVREFKSFNGKASLIQRFMEQKNRRFLSDEQEKVFLTEYKNKIEQEIVDKWEVKFGLKVFRMRELTFYVMLLNYARKISSSQLKQIDTQNPYKTQVIIGTGKINQNQEFDIKSENQPSDITINERQAQFFQEKNSSMVSYAERQNFTLTKLLKVFYELLIHPEDIRNRRINTLNVSTLLETLVLTTFVSVSFFIYFNSLNEIKSYVSANAQITQSMQLAILMYNKVVSISEYQNDTQTLNRFIVMASKDQDEFYRSISIHMDSINRATSDFHSQQLYQYLKSPANYFYGRNASRKVQVLQFLEYFYYMTSKIRNDVTENNTLDVLTQNSYELDKIRQNFPELKRISSTICALFSNLTENTKRDLIIVAWTAMIVFLIVTLMFFLYTYNYHSFRYEQRHQCLEIYKTIPPVLIDKIKDYYTCFYSELFSTGSNKSVNIEEHLQNLNKNELTIEDNSNSSTSNNKIKFIGKQKFTGWVRSLIMFFAINTVNILITYEIVDFVTPLSAFMTNVNDIMQAQNLQLEAYLDIKGNYILSRKPVISPQLIDSILVSMNQNEVRFNQMVTFESDTLTLYDPQFYADFYKILVSSVCVQIQSMLDRNTYNDCVALAKGGLIEDGAITYMNYFQRKVRSALQDLKVNSTLRITSQGKDYFINRGFKEIDLAMSYNIKLFRKLIERIILGYKKGIDFISFINTIVLVLLIVPQVFSLVMWFHLVREQKTKLSLLYGSMLMIPPNIVRHVKNLPRMATKILEFQQN